MKQVDPSTFGTGDGAGGAGADAGASAQAGAGADDVGAGPADAAAGHEQPATTTDALWDALTSTHPSPPLETVESPWDPTNGGMKRVFRGIQKMTGTDGLPAWADLLIGTAEFVVTQQGQGDAQQQSSETPNVLEGPP